MLGMVISLVIRLGHPYFIDEKTGSERADLLKTVQLASNLRHALVYLLLPQVSLLCGPPKEQALLPFPLSLAWNRDNRARLTLWSLQSLSRLEFQQPSSSLSLDHWFRKGCCPYSSFSASWSPCHLSPASFPSAFLQSCSRPQLLTEPCAAGGQLWSSSV